MNPAQPTVYFVREVPWETVFPISTRMLAAEFARDGWNVVWITPPLPPWHALGSKRLQYPDRDGRYAADNVFAISPSTCVPFSRHFPLDRPALAAAMWRGCLPALERTFARRGVPRPDLLFLSHWAAFGIRHLYPDVPIVYHVTDNYEAMPSVPATVRTIQQSNLQHTRHAIVTAPALKQHLMDRYAFPQSKITVAIHGVTYERFANEPAPAAALNSIPRPRLVALGNMQWLPYEGMLALAQSIPDAHVVLLGPITEPMRRLAGECANVHALGPVKPHDVPGYLSACDVGLIVFGSHVDAFANEICPMKLFEYAAAGLPTVSTPLPIYRTLDVPIWQAAMSDEFIAAVREALEAPPELRGRMRAFARANTWQRRYEEIAPILRPLVDERLRA